MATASTHLRSPLVAQHRNGGIRIRNGADVVPALAAHETPDSRLFLGHDLVQRPRAAVCNLARCPASVLPELEEIGCFEATGNRGHDGGHA